MTVSLTDRYLGRLRWSLTGLFSVATLAALAILALVVLRIDNDLRWANMGDTLITRAQLASEGVTFDGDGDPIAERFLADDVLTEGWPPAWVFEADGDEVLALAGPVEDYYEVEVGDMAARVLYDGVDWTEWVGDLESGSEVYGRGVPIRDPIDGEPRAVAVAVVDQADFLQDHATLRTRIWLAVAALTAAAAGAGYWMAGRGTAATGSALALQERLLSDAAHELRTPVAKIRAVAESGLAGDEPTVDALDRVVRLGEDAGQMVDDMLVLARMDAGREEVETQPLRLDLLVEQIASGFPDVKVEAVETVVDGDPGLLRRAVSNLVRNAVTHGGTQVKITVYPTKVVVTDRGPGLSAAAEHLFERFHKGAESGGHGLGLPIVRWIADAHGGTIRVINREGDGVEATLDLAR